MTSEYRRGALLVTTERGKLEWDIPVPPNGERESARDKGPEIIRRNDFCLTLGAAPESIVGFRSPSLVSILLITSLNRV